MKDKKDRLEIQELFMAKAGNDFSRCFHGTIRRETCVDGNPIVYGKIRIGDGYICAMASHQDELGERLDDMVLMILDEGLHNVAGVTTKIFDMDFFQN